MLYTKNYPVYFKARDFPPPNSITSNLKASIFDYYSNQHGVFITKGGYHLSIIDTPNSLLYSQGQMLEIMATSVFPPGVSQEYEIPLNKTGKATMGANINNDVFRFSAKHLDKVLDFFENLPSDKKFSELEKNKLNVYHSIMYNDENKFNENFAPKMFKRSDLHLWAIQCNCDFPRIIKSLKKEPVYEIIKHTILGGNFKIFDALYKNNVEANEMFKAVFDHHFKNNDTAIKKFKLENFQAEMEARKLFDVTENSKTLKAKVL